MGRTFHRGISFNRLFWIGISSFILLSSALAVVYSKHLYRKLHIQLQHLQQARDSLHNEWTQLLLEQGTLASDVRVEKIARETLKMKIPDPTQTQVINP